MRAPQTAIQWVLPPASPTVIAEELGECKQQVSKETGLAQVTEVPTKGMNSMSPEACLFPSTEC